MKNFAEQINKKFTKKQIGTSSVILGVLVVGGVTAGVVTHNNNVHAQQVAQKAKVEADKKAKQLAEEKEIAQEKEVAQSLETASKNPSDATIKAAKEAISKLTDETVKAKDTNHLKTIEGRLALIKAAQTALKDYQAHATDSNKQKVAQNAINAIKDKNDEKVKADLQKAFDASNKQAQEAAKAEQAKASQQASAKSNQSASSNDSKQSNRTANNNTSDGTNNQASSNGGSSNGYAQNSQGNQSYQGNTNTGGNTQSNPNTGGNSQGGGNSNANSGGSTNNNNNNSTPTPTPQPTIKYMGWVSVDGVVKYSQNFNSDAEATAYASGVYNSKAVEDLMFAGHSISWGVRPVQG